MRIYMKNNTLLIKLLTVLFGVILIAVSAFSWYYIPMITGKSADDVLSIEVRRHNGYPPYTTTYMIDFTNNTLTSSEEDGQTEYRHFSEENKDNFIGSANLYGFWDWKEEYIREGVYDATGVGIDVLYADGSEQSIYCYGWAAPNYEQISDVFYNNFGFRL